jgi:hypothetical protein
MLENLCRDDFAAQLDTTFTAVLATGDRVPLDLIEVTPQRDSPRVDNYSLLFRGPAEKGLIQSIYALQHEVIGALDLFLVPVGKEADGFRYEAVINRLREAKPQADNS